MALEFPNPWIAYVGPFSYPEGGAPARRIQGVAKSLTATGLDVVIVAGGGQVGSQEVGAHGPGRISIVSVPERVAEHMPRPLRRMRYAGMGQSSVKWLETQPSLPRAVILYGGYSPYLWRLLKWSRRNQVCLIFDAVEWYEPTYIHGYLLC